MHERGMADDELVEDHERERFSPVMENGGTVDRDGDGHTLDDRAREAGTMRDGTTGTAPGTTTPDDERRFDRPRDDVRESDRAER